MRACYIADYGIRDFVANALTTAGAEVEPVDRCELKVLVGDWEFTLNVCNIDVVA